MREGVMRRLLVVAMLAVFASTLGVSHASAGEKQQSQFFYGSWKSHHRVDADTTIIEYWSLDAYRSGTRSAAFVYHTTARCTETEGRRRCDRRSTEFGSDRGLAADAFSVDSKLAGVHLEATMKLYKHNEVVGTAVIVADLSGTGDVTRAKESYSYRQGCELYKFEGHSRYRDAEGLPSVRVDGVAMQLGNKRDATIGAGRSLSIYKEC
jgi:hypothetical protein